MKPLKDEDVRPGLHAWLRERLPRTPVLDEVGLLHGDCRVDVLTLSARCLHGYEVKADADTLARLPRQVLAYSQVLDRCTLVVGALHLERAAALVPSWWGLVSVLRRTAGGVKLVPVRHAQPNVEVVPLSVARLLWRDEALALLRELGEGRGMSHAPRVALYRRLVDVLPAEVLRAHVRRRLLVREDWRPHAA